MHFIIILIKLKANPPFLMQATDLVWFSLVCQKRVATTGVIFLCINITHIYTHMTFAVVLSSVA